MTDYLRLQRMLIRALLIVAATVVGCSTTQVRAEEFWDTVKRTRIQLLGPTTSEGAPKAGVLTTKEVLAVFGKANPVAKQIDKDAKLRVVREKIADFVDQPRFYPLIGVGQVHHAYYRCTVFVDGKRQRPLYIDHLHYHLRGK